MEFPRKMSEIVGFRWGKGGDPIYSDDIEVLVKPVLDQAEWICDCYYGNYEVAGRVHDVMAEIPKLRLALDKFYKECK